MLPPAPPPPPPPPPPPATVSARLIHRSSGMDDSDAVVAGAVSSVGKCVTSLPCLLSGSLELSSCDVASGSEITKRAGSAGEAARASMSGLRTVSATALDDVAVDDVDTDDITVTTSSGRGIEAMFSTRVALKFVLASGVVTTTGARSHRSICSQLLRRPFPVPTLPGLVAASADAGRLSERLAGCCGGALSWSCGRLVVWGCSCAGLPDLALDLGLELVSE